MIRNSHPYTDHYSDSWFNPSLIPSAIPVPGTTPHRVQCVVTHHTTRNSTRRPIRYAWLGVDLHTETLQKQLVAMHAGRHTRFTSSPRRPTRRRHDIPRRCRVVERQFHVDRFLHGIQKCIDRRTRDSQSVGVTEGRDIISAHAPRSGLDIMFDCLLAIRLIRRLSIRIYSIALHVVSLVFHPTIDRRRFKEGFA